MGIDGTVLVIASNLLLVGYFLKMSSQFWPQVLSFGKAYGFFVAVVLCVNS